MCLALKYKVRYLEVLKCHSSNKAKLGFKMKYDRTMQSNKADWFNKNTSYLTVQYFSILSTIAAMKDSSKCTYGGAKT